MNDLNFWVLQFAGLLMGIAPIALAIFLVSHIANEINRAVGRPTETDHRDLRATPTHTPNVETQNLASLHTTTPPTTPTWMQALTYMAALYQTITRPRHCPKCGAPLHNGVCAYCGFEH